MLEIEIISQYLLNKHIVSEIIESIKSFANKASFVVFI
jgi:hypothetical protein